MSGAAYFRLAAAEDAAEMAALDRRAFRFPWKRSFFVDAIQNGYPSILLCIDKKIIGQSIYRCIFDEAEILTFCVDPDYQGKGWGRTLLAHTVAQMAAGGIKKIFLEVRVSNVNAIRLYVKSGFKVISTRKGYYESDSGRENAYIMQKSL